MTDERLVDLLISELGQIGPVSWREAYDTPKGRRWLAERLEGRIQERFNVQEYRTGVAHG